MIQRMKGMVILAVILTLGVVTVILNTDTRARKLLFYRYGLQELLQPAANISVTLRNSNDWGQKLCSENYEPNEHHTATAHSHTYPSISLQNERRTQISTSSAQSHDRQSLSMLSAVISSHATASADSDYINATGITAANHLTKTIVMQASTPEASLVEKTLETKTLSSITAANQPEYNTACSGPCITLHESWLCGDARLGNKLFMIAAAIAVPGKTFVFINTSQCHWVADLVKLFAGMETVQIIALNETRNWQVQGESSFTAFNPITASGHVKLVGYRQNHKYFTQTQEQIHTLKKLLRIHNSFVNTAKQKLAEIRLSFNQTNSTMIGVHMRLGDLKEDLRVSFGYQAAGATFYIKAFSTMVQRHGADLIFVIASDDIKWANRILRNLTTDYRIGFSNMDAFTDFTVLSQCDHSIMSGGTYGFWSAWLAGGEVIYFKDFAKPGSSFAKDFCSECFYLPNWIPV